VHQLSIQSLWWFTSVWWLRVASFDCMYEFDPRGSSQSSVPSDLGDSRFACAVTCSAPSSHLRLSLVHLSSIRTPHRRQHPDHSIFRFLLSIAVTSSSTAFSRASIASSMPICPPHVYIARPSTGSRRSVRPLKLKPWHFCARRQMR
jgi:hypothetical protein